MLFALHWHVYPHAGEVTSGCCILKYQPTMTQIALETRDSVSPHSLLFSILLQENRIFKAPSPDWTVDVACNWFESELWNPQALVADSRSTPLLRHVSWAIACVGVTIMAFIRDAGCWAHVLWQQHGHQSNVAVKCQIQVSQGCSSLHLCMCTSST